MALLLAACCFLFLFPNSNSSFKLDDQPMSINDVNKINKSQTALPALSQSAPYTIFDENVGVVAIAAEDNKQNTTSLRNVLFRLTNGTTNHQLEHQLGLDSATTMTTTTNGHDNDVQKPPVWMLIGPNGTVVGHKLNLNIEKLLENLNSNNFTSEILVDNENPSRIINITISGGVSVSDKASSSLDEMLLEELIMDSMPVTGSAANAPLPVYRDNHRFGQSQRNKTLRPKPPQQHKSNDLVTPPPIIRAMEVVAENYTIRQVSEEANVFGLKLLHQINLEKVGGRNVIQAPFAVYQGLGLLMTGAQGDTAKELDKVLLGVQSSYENQKLTHDQDKNRLLASFSDVVRQLHHSATHHLRSSTPLQSPLQATDHDGQAFRKSDDGIEQTDAVQRANSGDPMMIYGGGTSDQHLILANNLLFLPSAHEISSEFKQYVTQYFNQTALTKIEVGSTESIQTINGWIRQATNGLVSSLIDKRQTFDETNVMSLLSSAWFQQEWRDDFHKVSSPLRSGIRLKGQGRAHFNSGSTSIGKLSADDRANLLEFVDDNKQSHFMEYIRSEPTKNIHLYNSILNGQPVELITVPFRDSNHRLIAITPLPISSQTAAAAALMNHNLTLSLQHQQQHHQQNTMPTDNAGQPPIENLPDSSALSKLIAAMSNSPRKVMRSIWNIIAPDIITKQTLQTIQQARQKNITIDEQLVGANVIPLVQLSIPIFRTGSDSSLSAALNHIGLVNTFDPYQANFIGINGHPFNYYKLHLSNVIFKTTFNLNERGINYDRTIRTLESMRIHSNVRKQQQSSTADKSTGGDDSTTTFKIEFVDDVKLNKPFVYMICDMRTKLILYAGALRNPAQSM